MEFPQWKAFVSPLQKGLKTSHIGQMHFNNCLQRLKTQPTLLFPGNLGQAIFLNCEALTVV